MATPFFSKREPELTPAAHPSAGSSGPSAAGPLRAGSPTAASQRTGLNPAAWAPDAASGAAASATASAAGAPVREGGSRLIVGPNIKLKGVEITDCDTLVVEGLVEATMDSRLMQIAPIGAFQGSAQIDTAEIHGAFDGDLTVRDKLVIYATGRVSGTIRYGKLVIEEGGQLSGQISFGTGDKARSATAAANAGAPGGLKAA
ncbi:polymer-forming protein [Tibeticola sediminis]|uniref:Polymer-forming protein n=1 Tax=Tibeticola sediminis TaxID=1917811 RepID=A0A3N4URW4_9BURK|nr:polymer-forming cytoskeletal protein [Tibeticola sediminis]RPE72788.1 polymer-forming protein [Tibeticola sediminis]